jgi:hypothetical protein
MNDSVDARDFGRLEAEVSQLKLIIEEMRGDMKAMKADWDTAKGGTKVLFVVASVVGTAVAALGHWLLGKI